MRIKTLTLAFLMFAAPAFTQNAPKPEPSDTKVALAQKDVQIAPLKVELIKAQAQLAFEHAQAQLAAAQKVLADVTPKPEAPREGQTRKEH